MKEKIAELIKAGILTVNKDIVNINIHKKSNQSAIDMLTSVAIPEVKIS